MPFPLNDLYLRVSGEMILRRNSFHNENRNTISLGCESVNVFLTDFANENPSYKIYSSSDARFFDGRTLQHNQIVCVTEYFLVVPCMKGINVLINSLQIFY